MNKDKWDSLTPEQQKVLSEAAAETQEEIRNETKNEDLQTTEALKAEGMEVFVVPDEEMPLWQAATMQVRADFIRENGEIGQKVVDECLKANE